MKRILISISFILIYVFVRGQSLNSSYLAYIEQYHTIAVQQQKTHGIPASITLAQGLLESGAGRSLLAVEGNNHFGIKCHDWTGKKIYKDDDAKNECFRKYKHAKESYEDHSLFLTGRSRYAALFQLDPTNYAAWAHGLKAAGYATDPAYAQKLINLIELYNLHQYDVGTKKSSVTSVSSNEIVLETGEQSQETPSADTKMIFQRSIYKSNYIKMVVATGHDSFASLAEELGVAEKKLRKYNEVDEQAELKYGDIVYLAKKKKRASRANQIHIVKAGETLYGISQTYGIQLLNLYKMNDLPFTQGAYVGQIIKLR